MQRVFFLAVVMFVFHARVNAVEVDFVRDVRPIFQKHCYSCHGPTKQKSGLRLDVKAAAFKGGDGYGASLVAGKASESPLIELVTSDDEDSRMPPEGKPLSAAQIRTLKIWVDVRGHLKQRVGAADQEK